MAWQRLRQLAWAIALFLVAWLGISWINATQACHPMPTSWPGGNVCALLKFAYDWQNILAGFAAIIAAFVGGYFIHKQIRLTDEHEKERIRRKHAAARAMLPLALSSLAEYAEACGRLLRNIHIQCQGQTVPQSTLQNLQLPAIPANSTVDLKSMVESSGAAEGKAIATLLSEIQVLASRLSSLQGPHRPGHVIMLDNIETYMMNALEIYARASELFEYARGETDETPVGRPNAASMRSALFSFGWHEPRFDGVRARMASRGAR